MLLGDGVRCRPCQISVIDQDLKSSMTSIDITLEESKPKQIERMLEAISCKFVSLKRIAFGPVTLKGLRKGQWREMTQSEIFALKKSCKRSDGKVGFKSAIPNTESVPDITDIAQPPSKSRKFLKGLEW